MSNEFYNIDEIDEFILGHLSQNKVIEIKRKIQEDEKFAELVRERKNLKMAIELQGREVLKNKIRTIHANSGNGSSGSKGFFNGPLFYITGGLALIAASYFLFLYLDFSDNGSSQLSTQEVYAQYFQPFDISEVKRSGGDAGDIDQTLVIENLYSEGKYSEVIPLLMDKLSKSSNRSSSDLIALGISYLETNQYENALTSFTEILESQDFGFEDDARWYSGLAHLKQGNIEKVKLSLQPLTEDINADYHREAVSLLKSLK